MSGFGKRKKLGQNFLVDRSVVDRIVASARLTAADRVVEVGPGKGILTKALVETGASVTAVELDEGLYDRLVGDDELTDRVTFIHANALRFDFDTIAAPYHVVANLPYSVGTPIVERLIGQRTRIVRMTVMVQAEVGRRMVARPGDPNYGTLSLFVGQYCDGEVLFPVPPGAFRPAPKVASVVIRLTPRQNPRVTVGDERALFELIHEAFRHRRKTLWNNLRERWESKEAFARACAAAGVDPADRPERVSLEGYAALYDRLNGS
jgi:16S rRNA (adenine1518-N6/adenine1519-N6)-dimethyltransferase